MKKVICCLVAVILLTAGLVLSVGADTNGFVFNIKGVNISITGEDCVIITNEDSYQTCNPKWAATVLCDIVEENVLKVAQVIVGSGTIPENVFFDDGRMAALVVHSSTSDETQSEQYPNVFAKNTAKALQAGQYIILEGIDLASGSGSGQGTVSDKIPEKKIEESSEEPETSVEESPEDSSVEVSETAAVSKDELSGEETVQDEPGPTPKGEEPDGNENEPTPGTASVEASAEPVPEQSGLSTTTIILIAVAAAVVIAAVVAIIIIKKKGK